MLAFLQVYYYVKTTLFKAPEQKADMDKNAVTIQIFYDLSSGIKCGK